jgi:hypothetical protein
MSRKFSFDKNLTRISVLYMKTAEFCISLNSSQTVKCFKQKV